MIPRLFSRLPVMALLLFCVFVQIHFIAGLFSDKPLFFSLFSSLVLMILALLIGLLPVNLPRTSPTTTFSTPEWLSFRINQLAQQCDLRTPMLQIVHMPGVNAFATSNVFLNGRIFLQAEMLHSLTQEEIESVVSHEICHIRNGHATVLTFVQGLTLPVSLPLAFLLGSIGFVAGKGQGFSTTVQRINSLIGLICFPLMSLIALRLTRNWEFEADRCAAELVGQDQYIQTLRCLHGSFFQHPNLLRITTGNDEHAKYSIAGLSHPDLSQRIKALQEIGR